MSLHTALKRMVRRGFARVGYAVRHWGRGVAGVELLHDARVLLGNAKRLVLFDVGANVGQTTRAMLDRFRTPRITAFEPSPSTFETLRAEARGRAGVALEPLALGSAAGSLPFHVTRHFSINDSLLAPAWGEAASVVQARVDTVDGYCGRQRIACVSLLKIDAQGTTSRC